MSCMLSSCCLAIPQPLFFVASQNHVRVYNLVKQQLVRKLLGGAGRFTSLALHPTGDHVLTGAVPFLPVTACSCPLLSLQHNEYLNLSYCRVCMRTSMLIGQCKCGPSPSDHGPD